jgi:hypothetical protein
MARKGKIESIPWDIRREVHQRLLDGQTGSQILPWLNALNPVRKVLDRSFASVDVSDENLSNFRDGPHREWLRRHEREQHIRSLTEYAHQLAEAAGGSMSTGAQAIAAGRLLEVMETGAFEEEDLSDLVSAIASLRKLELSTEKQRLQERRLDQQSRAQDLDEKKFQVRTCELFLTWYQDEEARRVASGAEEKTVKVEKLRQMMFGESPLPEGEATP